MLLNKTMLSGVTLLVMVRIANRAAMSRGMASRQEEQRSSIVPGVGVW